MRIPNVSTMRLSLETFGDADIPALAEILAEPEVTRNITANGATPERCLTSAKSRIGWHNEAWSDGGYGVWAMKLRDDDAAPRGTLLGWCGFAAPDIGEDPEILYGVAPAFWRKGFAMEAARAAIDWLFSATACSGVSAVIFERLNPVSVAMVGKLGMKRRGEMTMEDFLSSLALAREVLDYEIWRLEKGACQDATALLFQAPYKGGQIASLMPGEVEALEEAFCRAAAGRRDYTGIVPAELERRVRTAFRQGAVEPRLAWYHLPRISWSTGAA